MFQALFYGVGVFYPGIKVSSTIPLAQAVQETGSWTSNVYLKYNNMFGMFMPSLRSTTAVKSALTNYATYRSPLDSIRDYWKWLEYNKLDTDEKLINYIAAGKYAEDKNYYSAIKRNVAAFADQLYSPQAFGLVAVGGIGLSAAAFKLLADK